MFVFMEIQTLVVTNELSYFCKLHTANRQLKAVMRSAISYLIPDFVNLLDWSVV